MKSKACKYRVVVKKTVYATVVVDALTGDMDAAEHEAWDKAKRGEVEFKEDQSLIDVCAGTEKVV